MKVTYSEDHRQAFFDGLKFRKDMKTGYYLGSKKTYRGKVERLHRYVWRFYNGSIPVGGGAALMMSKESVLCAEETFSATDTEKQEHAAERAQVYFVGIEGIRPCGRQPVYNMEVEDLHNFSVNGGIIVHNCMDATRYFVNTLRIWREKEPYIPLYGR